MISKKNLCEYVERVKEVCDSMSEEGWQYPTPFEFETALGFLYFRDKKCDVVVLETGMGGETDATNVIRTTMIAVLASISMDHMQFLGNTLEQIAGVKAGIIKRGIQVVSTWQEPEAEGVIRETCRDKAAVLHMADRGQAKLLGASAQGLRFSYQKHKGMKLALKGTYQLANAAAALEVLDCLAEKFGIICRRRRSRRRLQGLSGPEDLKK